MDWTGGVRKRFSASKSNTVVQKQKAHFAKARAALQHTPTSKHTSKTAGVMTATYSRKPVYAHSQVSRSVDGTKALQRHQSRSTHSSSNAERCRERDIRDMNAKLSPHRKQRSPSAVRVLSEKCSRSGNMPRPTTTVSARHGYSGSSINQEEQLLIANRRRLLARSDWLGLAATRPVHLKFRSSKDKDRVGKRRKIDKAGSHQGKAADRHLLSPLFEDRLTHPDYETRGALPAEHLHIRVGTDALETTQRSCQTHDPRATSLRAPSTEFGPLSEESMLLGADGDIFEAGDSPQPLGFHNCLSAPPAPSMVVRAESLLSTDSQPMTPQQAPLPAIMDTVSFAVIPHEADPQQQSEPAPEHYASIENGEKAWRGLLDIKPLASSRASVAALKSSSQHVTITESGSRDGHIQGLHAPVSVAEGESFSSPIGPGTAQGNGYTGTLEDSAIIDSPSASLKQITGLAAQPVDSKQLVKEEADDNALWKEFVLHSQDEDSEDSLTRWTFGNDGEEPAHSYLPSVDVSGLGTSNEATVGDTVFVSGSTSSRVSKSIYERTAGLPIAANRKLDEDNIEDAQLWVPSPRRRSNIHAPATSVLNPRRFKRPKREAAPPKLKPSRFRHVREAEAAQRSHSVYDIPQSE